MEKNTNLFNKKRDKNNILKKYTIIILIIYFFAIFFPVDTKGNFFLFNWPVDNILDIIFILTFFIFLFTSIKNKIFKNKIIIYSIILFSFVIIILKLFVINLHSNGFEACYKIISPIEKQSNKCERTWNNIWNPNYTRYDKIINFGFLDSRINKHVVESNWNLSALNSNKYSYYNEDQPNPFRLGLEVNWKLKIPSDQISIKYIGKILITQKNKPILTFNSPDMVATQNINFFGDQNGLDLTYSWDPKYDLNNFAAINIKNLDGTFITIPPTSEIKLLIFFINFLTLLSIFLIIFSYLFEKTLSIHDLIQNFNPYFIIYFFLVISTFFISKFLTSHEFKIISVVFLLSLIIINISRIKHLNHIYVLFGLFLYSILFNKFYGHGNISKVIYRERGSDFLTYFSFAREILNSGSLQGGENIFVYSPAIRYLTFLLQILLGDSDNFIFLLYIFVLFCATHFFVVKIFKLTFVKINFNKVQILFFTLTFLFYSFLLSNPVVFAGLIYWSEFPTWILLVCLFIILPSADNNIKLQILFGFICGLIIMFRANQLIGILLLILFFLLHNKINRINKFIYFLIPFLISSSIAFLHNLYFGNSYIFLQTSLPLPVNFPLRVYDLLYIFDDMRIQKLFLNQFSGILANSQDLTQNKYFTLFLVSVRFSQILYILIILFIFANKRYQNFENIIFILIPLGFFIPHIFIQIFVYHPRHIIIGYLSIYLISFYIFYLSRKQINN